MIYSEDVHHLGLAIAAWYGLSQRNRGSGVDRAGFYTQSLRYVCKNSNDFTAMCVRARWIVARGSLSAFSRGNAGIVAMSDCDYVIDWGKVDADQRRIALKVRGSEDFAAKPLRNAGDLRRSNGRFSTYQKCARTSGD